MVIKIEIKNLESFVSQVTNLYKKHFSGSLYFFHSENNIGEYTNYGTVKFHNKNSDIFRKYYYDFIVREDDGTIPPKLRFDHSILTGEGFIINPRNFYVRNSRFAYQFGNFVGKKIAIIPDGKRELQLHDASKYGEFISEYRALLIEHSFNKSRALTIEDSKLMLNLCEAKNVPLEIFFPKDYENLIEIEDDFIMVDFGDHISVCISSDNKMHFTSDSKLIRVSESDAVVINNLIRKYSL